MESVEGRGEQEEDCSGGGSKWVNERGEGRGGGERVVNCSLFTTACQR